MRPCCSVQLLPVNRREQRYKKSVFFYWAIIKISLAPFLTKAVLDKSCLHLLRPVDQQFPAIHRIIGQRRARGKGSRGIIKDSEGFWGKKRNQRFQWGGGGDTRERERGRMIRKKSQRERENKRSRLFELLNVYFLPSWARQKPDWSARACCFCIASYS